MRFLSLGLGQRLRRAWPVVLVVSLVAGLVATTLLASLIADATLTRLVQEQPGSYDLVIESNAVKKTALDRPLTEADLDRIRQFDNIAQADWAGLQLTVGYWPQAGPVADQTDDYLTFQTRPGPDFSPLKLSQGSWPGQAGQVALSDDLARERQFRLGDLFNYRLPGSDQPGQLELVGLFHDQRDQADFFFGGYDVLADQTAIVAESEPVWSLETASPDQAGGEFVLAESEWYYRSDLVLIRLKRLADIDQTRSQLETYLSQSQFDNCCRVSPGLVGAVGEIVTFVTYFVGFFVFLAVVVSVYVIFNVFQVSLQRQLRSLALLRLNGATVASTWLLLTFEAVCLALVGALLALVLSFLLLALAWWPAGNWLGVDLVWGGLSAGLFLWPVLTALIATGLAALIPVWRASFKKPIEVLRPGPARPLRWVVILTVLGSVITTLAGLGLVFWVWLGPRQSLLAGLLLALLALTFLLGLSILSAGLTRPFGQLVSFLGRRRLGWRLAAVNISRHPGRAATIANSLLIGVCLIVFVTVVASSTKASMTALIDRQLPAQIWVSDSLAAEDWDSASWDEPDPGVISPELKQLILDSGLIDQASVWSFQSNIVRFVNQDQAAGFEPEPSAEARPSTGFDLHLAGVNPDNLLVNFNFNFSDDPELVWSQPDSGAVFLNRIYQDDYQQGGQIDVQFRTGSGDQFQQRFFLIGGWFDHGQIDLILRQTDYEAIVADDRVALIGGQLPAGLNLEEAKDQLTALVSPWPEVAVYDVAGDVTALFNRIIDTILNVFRGLLGLCLVVAVLGIFCTLILAIRERIKEFGVLRSFGLTRVGTGLMVAWEGLLMSLFGTILGISAGLFFASLVVWFVKRSSADSDFEGLITVSWAWDQIGLYVLIAGCLGFLAALIPAYLASRGSVSQALSNKYNQ